MTKIIHAGMHDLEMLAPLFDAYRQFYGQRTNLADSRHFLEERIIRNESVLFLARQEDGTPSGFVQFFPSFSSVAMRRLWILNDLFVHPEYRGYGIGEQLLHHGVVFARQTGAVGLVLETAADNAPARRLYERTGWVRDNQFITYRYGLEQ
ncbi:MAG: N-acetyltransferase [Bacteroidia bacterium]|nr:MAG: N-acetyltransferase [Bacteroidia bacterium]